jgi:hypothetical protein
VAGAFATAQACVMPTLRYPVSLWLRDLMPWFAALLVSALLAAVTDGALVATLNAPAAVSAPGPAVATQVDGACMYVNSACASDPP